MAVNSSKAGQELSKLGASKGGRARASVLSQEERRDIARRAVKVRWMKAKGIDVEDEQVSESPDQTLIPTLATVSSEDPVPYSMFQGVLTIGDTEFACHVLDNGKRVIAQREVVHLLTGVVKGNLDRYLTTPQLQDYLDPKKIQSRAVQFQIPGTHLTANGYEAELLVEICDAYLRARSDKKLGKNQENLARRSEIIIRACAKVGIIALIDEATGFC